jgi:glycosyltransferase involved in cell wall biosynthesis
MSQSTAGQLHNIFEVPLDDMTVIPPIIHSEYYSRSQEEIERLCDKYQLPDRFWLYVSHFYQHKNHSKLLRAYHQLKKDGHQPWTLVLRGDLKGKEREFTRLIQDLDLQGDVLMLPRLPEAELAALYSAASALVFPSTYEGGGIPLIEAMACGCPIVASDIPAVREFCDNAVAYLNPDNVFAIGEAMLELQNNLILRSRLQRLSLQRARRYRAPEVVNELIAAYRSGLDFRVRSVS